MTTRHPETIHFQKNQYHFRGVMADKKGRKKRKPCQMRYVSENRRDKNKRRRALQYSKKFGVSLMIRTKHGIERICAV